MPVTTLPARGRPTLYSEEIAAEICERLASGESLRQICRDEHLPQEPTVRLWAIEDREGFSARYSRSREIGWHAMAEETLEIADDGSNDWYERETKSGRKVKELDGEHVQRSRLRVDTRKWLLAKMLPAVFSDRVRVDVNERAAEAIGDEELARIATGSGARAS